MNKTKQITNTIVNDNSIQKIIFKCLAGSLVILSLCYVYFVGSITFNVLARKSLSVTAHELGSHIGQLELSYLSQTNMIDKSYALTHGFVDSQKPIFATRANINVAIR